MTDILQRRCLRSLVVLAWAGWLMPATVEAFNLQHAIDSATPGRVVCVPPGRYAGPIVIHQTLVLDGGGEAIIDAGGQGDAVRITAPDVTVRNFRIRGTGDSLDQQNAGVSVCQVPRAIIENNHLEDVLVGVLLNGAKGSLVRHNWIHGKALDLARRGDAIRLWNSAHSRVEDNRVDESRDVVVWYSESVRLTGNVVRHSRYGLHFMYSSGSVIEDNHFLEKSVGTFLMYSRDIEMRRNVLDHNRGPSGYGVGLKDMDGLVLEETVFAANRVGLYVDNSPSRVDVTHTIRRNVFAYNDIALGLLPAVRQNRFSDNSFIENVEQVAVLGGGRLRNNEFTVNGRGNYWSDYEGIDANGDGVGDLPYRATGLFENLLDREPKLRLFIYSPAQQAIEFAARAFPIFRPEPKITDAAPLMEPVPVRLPMGQAASPWALPTFSAGLLGVTGFVIGGARRWRRKQRGTAGDVGDPTVACRSGHGPVRGSAADVPFAGPVEAPVSPLVRAAGLEKSFGRQRVVDAVSFEVPVGDAVALWGVNGAGKTTIIKCLLGLYHFRGNVRIGGIDVRRQGKAARRLAGYVSQEFAFYEDLPVADIVRLFAQLKGMRRPGVEPVLERVGLTDQARKQVGALSGGMKQRLALAVALLGDPPLLLLDEPTSNLDSGARRTFFELLGRLKASGKTIVYTTHRREEVCGLADRVILLERGAVVRSGPPDEVMNATPGSLVMRISLDEEYRNQARDTLARAGFAVQPNHTALLVRVASDRKAKPLIILQQAGIVVPDFEIEPEAGDDR